MPYFCHPAFCRSKSTTTGSLRGSPNQIGIFYGYVPPHGPQLRLRFDRNGLYLSQLGWRCKQRWVHLSWNAVARIQQPANKNGKNRDLLEFLLLHPGGSSSQLSEQLIQLLGRLMPAPKYHGTKNPQPPVQLRIRLARHTGLEFIGALLEENLVHQSRCGFLHLKVCFKPNLDYD